MPFWPSLWRHECVLIVSQPCTLRHEPTFFCSCLVKSEWAWLRPDEPKFKKNYFCYINIDKNKRAKTADWNICIFSTISKQPASSFGVPFSLFGGITRQELTVQLFDEVHQNSHVTNEEVRAKIQQAIGPHIDLPAIEKRRKLQWYGHVSRSSGLAKTILQGTVKGGRRRSRKKKRWEDNIREWTGLEFAKPQKAVENREKRRKLVAKWSVVPQRPSWLRAR